MQRSTTLCLLISAILLACGTSRVKGLTIQSPESDSYQPPYFADKSADYIYKANISVYGHELSGIFIVKKTADTIHRAVFTTEFGNKLLDLEVSDHAYKINDIVDELNRKVLIATLVTDFRLLLRNTFPIQARYTDSQSTVLSSEEDRKHTYLYVDRSNTALQKIGYGSTRKEKITITFHPENNIFADTISIQHHNIKLRIDLNHLQNQP